MANVTMIGAAGRVTVSFSSDAAASIAGGIENILLGLVNRGAMKVQDFHGSGTPTLRSGQPSAALIQSSGYSQIDSARVPFIQVAGTGTTNLSNRSGVQTVVAAGGGTMLYTAINPGSPSSPGAVVWVSGGVNAVRATEGATADFNFDGGVSLIDGSFGATTTNLMSGLATIHGANGTFATSAHGTPTLIGASGSTRVEIGGAKASASALLFVGSAGATVRMRGNASLVVQDPSAGQIVATRNGGTAIEGQVSATVSGAGNILDGGGSSPTVAVTDGSLFLSNTAVNVTVINPAGKATIAGGVWGLDAQGRPGWRPGIGTGWMFVRPGNGSVTVYGGHTGGSIYGSRGGNNLLVAGDFSIPAVAGPHAAPAVTTTLVGGGRGDTLIAGPGGADVLTASYGNTTLIGAGTGQGNLFTLGRTSDWGNVRSIGADVATGNNGADTFVLGTGDATITGGHSAPQTGRDLYIDYGTQAVALNATVEIRDFKLGTDILHLAPTEGATVVATPHDRGSTSILLSDGLHVTFDHLVAAPLSMLVSR